MGHRLVSERRRVSLVCIMTVVAVMGSVFLNSYSRAALPHVAPEQVGFAGSHFDQIDAVVAEGIDAGQMPGCVVLVARHGKIAFLKAYGNRAIEPTAVPMTTDTVFDMASLTKPVATATSVMVLVDREMVRLDDPVAQHVAEFGQNDKGAITIYQLLTHQGGLIADNPLRDYTNGPEEAFRRIFGLKTVADPGKKFIYTDVGFIMLGKMVHRVTGQSLDQFATKKIFVPLGMSDTSYLPGKSLRDRVAPTERRNDAWMQGEVHDPRAYELGGVAGHAGVFSTAEDMAVYAQMMLGNGTYNGKRILSQKAVRTMTAGYPVPNGLRGLGWDVRTGYSSNRGEGFSRHAFGHGGFTGTAMWIDPELDLAVIFLANRLHPDGKGSVNPIAGKIGTIVAEAITDPPPGNVLPGLDALERDDFKQLAGRRVGVITNHTGVNRDGVSAIQLLHDAKNVELAAVFSPEHGLEGKLDVSKIGDTEHTGTSLKVYSLYGKTRRPTPEMLEGLDAIVFDIQDIGARFYTYISTMGNAMEEAAKHDLEFFVLDRPNPIDSVAVEGPILDDGKQSFVGYHRIPIRHGMTVGELARMFNDELNLDLKLTIIPVEDWQREQLFDRTGLTWINPSPNMRNLTEALLYPGIGLLETTNLSVGRGTEIPFEIFGAPWLDGSRLAKALNEANTPGVRFVPITFTPQASKFEGEVCGGVRILVADREKLESVRVGLEVAVQIWRLHPEDWKIDGYARLLGNDAVLNALREGKTAAEIEASYQGDLTRFLERREAFLLY
jgi:uncharacterized protein YbbC (DUF1343 family)